MSHSIISDPAKPWTIGVRKRTAGDPTGTLDYPVLGGPLGAGGSLFLHEYGWLENGVPRAPMGEVYAETGAITLGEGDKRFHVQATCIRRRRNHARPTVGIPFLCAGAAI